MRRDLSDWYDNVTPASRHSVNGHGGLNPADRRQAPHARASTQSNQGQSESRQESRQLPRSEDASNTDRSESEYENHHIYGKGSALCFSADQTRSKAAHTVRIEGASSNGPRDFNWSDKISLQFTIKELPFVLAVLMGWIPKVQFVAHGPANDKGVSLEVQEGPKIFVKIWQKDRGMRSVPVPQSEVFLVVDLFLKQMMRNSPRLTSDTILAMCKSVTRGHISP
jgi:hypothetical protein